EEQSLGQLQHVLGLQRSNQVGVVDAALVPNRDIAEAPAQLRDLVQALLHRLAGAIDARVPVHQGPQLPADVGWILRSVLLQQAVEDAFLFFPRLAFRRRVQLGALSQVLRDLTARDAAPYQA